MRARETRQSPLHQFNIESSSDHFYIDHHLEKKIYETAEPIVTARLGRWRLMDIREKDGALTIELMINEREEAVQSLTRNPDGTLTFRRYGKVRNSTPNFSRPPYWDEQLKDWTNQHILDIAIKLMPRKDLRAEIMNTRESLPRLIKSLTERIINKAVVPPTEDQVRSWPVRVDPQEVEYTTLRAAANEIVRRKFVNTDVRKLANLMFNPNNNPHQLTINHYNTTILNRKIVKELATSSLSPAQYYFRTILKDDGKIIRLKHPGQVIREVKQELKLTPAEWKYFCRVEQPKINPEEKEKGLRALRLRMRALVEINQPGTSNQDLRSIASRTNDYFPENTGPGRDDPLWRAWIHTANRFLQHSDVNDPNLHSPGIIHPDREKSQARHMMELSRVMDTVQNYVERGISWGPGDWNVLHGRSEKWHREMQNERDRKYTKEQKEATWTSLIPTTTVDRYEFEPITTGDELLKISAKMGNCLWSYPKRCADGYRRIFLVRAAGTQPTPGDVSRYNTQVIMAAVELSSNGSEWSLQQIEGPHRRKYPKGIKNAARKIRDMYQKASLESRMEEAPSLNAGTEAG